MKFLSSIYIALIITCMSCTQNADPDSKLRTENFELRKENDSLRKIIATTNNVQDAINETDSLIKSNTPQPSKGAGEHPITLHWIGWDKPGKAILTPQENGWYNIQGRQENTKGEYLNIDGKIKRLSEKELEFTGKIETRVLSNNNGKPCVKNGAQRFFASGTRKYFRLQKMENCEGGRLVDYVDIYPGTSGL